MKKFYIVPVIFLTSYIMLSQNMYNLSGWIPGSGNITDFNKYGPNSSNAREFGYNNINDNVVLWNAIPNQNNNLDGGFEGSYKNIDPTKTYRFSIWLKKTNSNDGKLFFGCHSYSNDAYRTERLNGDQINHPYFWQGDLPELDHWYLFIGYVHPNNYNGSNIGLILDGETGNLVQSISIQDFKFATSATNLRIRVFQNATNNAQDLALIYFPRLEQVDGSELPFVDLLNVNIGSKLVLNYDTEGNQNQRVYCYGQGCVIPVPESFSEEDIETVLKEGIDKESTISDNDFTIFPNPTSSILNISLSDNLKTKDKIKIYNPNGQKVLEFVIKGQSISTDLSELSSGLYLIHVYLENGSFITKKIFKN